MGQDWTTLTEEYTANYDLVKKTLIKGIANEEIANDNLVFIDVFSHLIARNRLDIIHLPEQKDIDKTQFIDLIQKEVGIEIPLTESIPIVEFLRENKHWYGHKGTEVLYDFIGDIVGSPIEVHYPRDLVARYSATRTCYSGKSPGGIRQWDDSALARVRDGKFWANYTYLVDITQAQNVIGMNDFLSLVKSIHPAGTKRFYVFRFKYGTETTLPVITHLSTRMRKAWFLKSRYPTLDNNLIASGGYRHSYSMHGGHRYTSRLSVRPAYKFMQVDTYKQIWQDSMLHEQIAGHEHWVFKRFKPKTDGTYETVYADNDQFVYDSQTTNMGMKDITLEYIADRTLREVANIAWDLDGKNMNTGWFQEMPHTQVTEL